MIIESVEISTLPEKRNEMRRAIAALVGPTTVEPGCISCHALLDSSDENAFRYEARWRSAEDLMSHLRSGSYRRLLVLMDLSDKPPAVEFHTVAKTQGFDLVETARRIN